MNSFLWAVLMYFDAYLEYNKAKCDENVHTPGQARIPNHVPLVVDLLAAHRSLGLKARQRLKKCEYELRQRQANLGHTYMGFVLGLGHRNSHHTRAGR